jgi:KaiC/GvpD/RAD55 family RecA-like ATPase
MDMAVQDKLRGSKMNAASAELLAHPHPCGHIIYPYTDEGLVGQAVTLFASAGIREGEGVVLIMARNHCESIRDRLQLAGIDFTACENAGQLICVVAEELMASFLREGVIDEDLFRASVDALILRAKDGSRDSARRVRVFGEMVSQLGLKDLGSTARLERLWNEVIERHRVALLCTYALVHSGVG